MKKYFLTGLATLLPLAVTIYAVKITVNFLTHPFVDAVTNLLYRLPIEPMGIITSEEMIHTISRILILIALFLFTLLVGVVARWFFVNRLIKIGDWILHRIPLVSKVYKIATDIIHTLFVSDQNSFKQVVMLPFPNSESYCLGLVTRDAPPSIGDDLVSVFLPTTPNPMTGFMVMSPKSELIYLDMKSEDAVKYIVSCGVIKPEEATP